MLRFRCMAPRPLRVCDDDQTWPTVYQKVMADWRKTRS
jgi:hypothetical protein